jgi:hypothetical protein
MIFDIVVALRIYTLLLPLIILGLLCCGALVVGAVAIIGLVIRDAIVDVVNFIGFRVHSPSPSTPEQIREIHTWLERTRSVPLPSESNDVTSRDGYNAPPR